MKIYCLAHVIIVRIHVIIVRILSKKYLHLYMTLSPCIKEFNCWMVVACDFNPSIWRQKQADVNELEVSLVCKVSSKTARTDIKRYPVSEKQNKQTKWAQSFSSCSHFVGEKMIMVIPLPRVVSCNSHLVLGPMDMKGSGLWPIPRSQYLDFWSGFFVKAGRFFLLPPESIFNVYLKRI